MQRSHNTVWTISSNLEHQNWKDFWNLKILDFEMIQKLAKFVGFWRAFWTISMIWYTLLQKLGILKFARLHVFLWRSITNVGLKATNKTLKFAPFLCIQDWIWAISFKLDPKLCTDPWTRNDKSLTKVMKFDHRLCTDPLTMCENLWQNWWNLILKCAQMHQQCGISFWSISWDVFMKPEPKLLLDPKTVYPKILPKCLQNLCLEHASSKSIVILFLMDWRTPEAWKLIHFKKYDHEIVHRSHKELG